MAEQIRRSVQEATGGLTCSCGVAPNRTLAKICSDVNKPNGQFEIAPTRDAVEAFVRQLPVRKVPGVGRVTEHVLKAFGVEKCSDILTHRALLAALFSPISMDFFLHCALGLGATTHPERVAEGEVGRKGISCERTFRALSDRADLEAKCKELSEHLAADMAVEGLRGKTLTLKLKLTTFEVRTRAVTLPRHIHTAEDILGTALRLLRAELPVEVRLMGLRMSHFWEEPRRDPGQPSLLEILERRRQRKAGEGGSEPGSPATRADNDGQTSSGKRKRGCAEGARVAGDGGGDEDEDVHRSQVLSAGEEVELTLVDWQAEEPQECITGAPGEQSAEPARESGMPEMHMPPTSLDIAARMGVGGKASHPADAHMGTSQAAKPAQTATWACSSCTYENLKGTAWCEMCGTSRSGRRPQGAGGDARTQKRKTKSQPQAGARSILGFCKPQGQ